MRHVGSVSPRGHRAWTTTCAIALLAVAALAQAQAPAQSAGTLDRIRAAGTIKIGYREDARPFSYKDESGNATGYSVALSQTIVEATKSELGLPALKVEWVPVTLESWSTALQQGQIDLLCAATSATLGRRKDVSFSIPIAPGGIGVMVRADAPARLREVLSGAKSKDPKWRASAGQLLQAQTFAAVTGTTAQAWLAAKLNEFQLTAKVVDVAGYDAGIQGLLDRKADAFFGDRAILLDGASRSASKGKLVVLDRNFTFEPVAFGMARGDEDFRLVVDRALSRLYASGEVVSLYAKWFGKVDGSALTFFQQSALPE